MGDVTSDECSQSNVAGRATHRCFNPVSVSELSRTTWPDVHSFLSPPTAV